MNRFKLALLFLICVSSVAFAQKEDYFTSKDFDVSLSKPFRVIDAKTKEYVNSKDHVIALKIEKKGFHIQSFDARDMRLVAKEEYPKPDKNEDLTHLTELDGKFYLFISRFDKGSNKEMLVAREINPANAKFKGPENVIISLDGKFNKNPTNFSYEKVGGSNNDIKLETSKYNFVTSKDRKSIFVHFNISSEADGGKSGYQNIAMYLFDQSLELKWVDVRQMQHPFDAFDITNFALDNEGGVHILAKVFKDGNKNQKLRKEEEINYTFQLQYIANDEEETVYTDIEMEGNKFVQSSLLHVDKQGNVVVGGYYRPAGSRRVEGLFLFKIDHETGESQKNYVPIPLEILNAYESKKAKRDNDRKAEDGEIGTQYLVLDAMRMDENGNYYLLGEEFKIVERTSSNSGSSITTKMYYYMDVWATKISNGGNLDWMVKIPKQQTGKKNPGGLSYNTLLNSDALYIIYVDNMKNLDLMTDDEPKQHVDGHGGYVTSAKIDLETGEISKQNLFDLRKVKGITAYQYQTRRMVNLADDHMAVEVYKKKKEDVWIRTKLN